MIVEFHPEVEEEIQQSYSWYEEQSPGLGDTFISEIDFTLKRIKSSPHANQKIKNNIRRVLVSKFPYGTLYALEEGMIYIVARYAPPEKAILLGQTNKVNRIFIFFQRK